MSDKLDLKKSLASLYNPPRTFGLVEVPAFNFLMIDGKGDPRSALAYGESVEALYAAAYTLKFKIKKEMGIDYAVMPLEGLWWSEPIEVFSLDRRDLWQWTMMILQPEQITPDLVEGALSEAKKKKKLPRLDQIRFESYHEGLSAQIMHLGPYVDEAPTLYRLHHEYIPAQGCEMVGKHHEIYLNDPNRTEPSKLKTVLRQPVRRKG